MQLCCSPAAAAPQGLLLLDGTALAQNRCLLQDLRGVQHVPSRSSKGAISTSQVLKAVEGALVRWVEGRDWWWGRIGNCLCNAYTVPRTPTVHWTR